MAQGKGCFNSRWFYVSLLCVIYFSFHFPEGDKDVFKIQPSANTAIFSYTPSLNNLKFSTAASAFPREVWGPVGKGKTPCCFFTPYFWKSLESFSFPKILDASPALDRRWRVAYAKAEKDLVWLFQHVWSISYDDIWCLFQYGIQHKIIMPPLLQELTPRNLTAKIAKPNPWYGY